jgi:hypothetical protein
MDVNACTVPNLLWRIGNAFELLVAQFLSSLKVVCLQKNCQAYFYATLAV